MYATGELSHEIVAFGLIKAPADDIWPIDGFVPNVIPPIVRSDHMFMMDASEICLHPSIFNILHVSNRWERQIAQREPHLTDVPKELPAGDTVAIILLSDNGRITESIKQIRTNVDVIRGIQLNDEGTHMVVVGQEGSGVEIYELGGERGDVWTLATGLNERLETGLKHAVRL